MSKNLVIVESPAKAKTIEKFLGSDFKVVSSNGHIADLPSNELGIDLENDYNPKYIISKDKMKKMAHFSVCKTLYKNSFCWYRFLTSKSDPKTT